MSFLFRTSHLVLRAHRRTAARRATAPLDSVEPPALNGHRRVIADIQYGECLTIASRHCTDEERAVLAAKLSGMTARDIARTLEMTVANVDHRFRSAITRIRGVVGEGTHA